jgi:hypothetical protein
MAAAATAAAATATASSLVTAAGGAAVRRVLACWHLTGCPEWLNWAAVASQHPALQPGWAWLPVGCLERAFDYVCANSTDIQGQVGSIQAAPCHVWHGVHLVV